MDFVYLVLGVVVSGFALNVIFKQSHNLVFIISRRPYIWVVFVYLYITMFWLVCFQLGLKQGLPIFATIFCFTSNFPPQDATAKEIADLFYEDLGIDNGKALSRFGRLSVLISGFLCWVYFYQPEALNNILNQLI